MAKVFIDGSSGTTGLRIRERLSERKDIELISVPYEERHDPLVRKDAMAKADIADVEEYIRSCGFYHGKARDLVLQANQLADNFGGRVPDNMEDLLTLAGVGRKSANLILGDVYNIPGAVVVDTHCIRLSNRMGLVDDEKDPPKIEKQLRAILPPEKSNDFCHRLVLHGRAVCTARKPECDKCCCATFCKTLNR